MSAPTVTNKWGGDEARKLGGGYHNHNQESWTSEASVTSSEAPLKTSEANCVTRLHWTPPSPMGELYPML